MHHPMPVAAGAALAVAGYLLLTWRGARTIRARHGWRTAAFVTGCALVAAALLPPIAPFAHADFRGHMLQHLLIGMYAPTALVLGAPVTTLLRALPPRRARWLAGVLRGRPVRALTHPVTALGLSTGGLAALYLTPLYETVTARPAWHGLLHAHFLVSGCLFAWSIAGPDLRAARPGVRTRLVVLGVAIAAHASIAQLMYGGILVAVHAPAGQLRGGAELMYYGGDIAELLLAAALVATWRPVRRGPATMGRLSTLTSRRTSSAAGEA